MIARTEMAVLGARLLSFSRLYHNTVLIFFSVWRSFSYT